MRYTYNIGDSLKIAGSIYALNEANEYKQHKQWPVQRTVKTHQFAHGYNGILVKT